MRDATRGVEVRHPNHDILQIKSYRVRVVGFVESEAKEMTEIEKGESGSIFVNVDHGMGMTRGLITTQEGVNKGYSNWQGRNSQTWFRR